MKVYKHITIAAFCNAELSCNPWNVVLYVNNVQSGFAPTFHCLIAIAKIVCQRPRPADVQRAHAQPWSTDGCAWRDVTGLQRANIV